MSIRYEFIADNPGKQATSGKALLFVNDKRVAEGHLDHSVAFRFSLYEGFDIGRDNGLPVSSTYAQKAPFPFTGKIEKVDFEVKP